jgi:hypothetical protein
VLRNHLQGLAVVGVQKLFVLFVVDLFSVKVGAQVVLVKVLANGHVVDVFWETFEILQGFFK